MNKQDKKQYQAPVVIDYGDVAELTQNSNNNNSDGQGNSTGCQSPFCSNG
ncbi:MAG: lasso RiPP family leader peptide-containing protein [Bacteroidota bacterium]